MTKRNSRGTAEKPDAELDALWEQFQSCAALLADDDVDVIERAQASAALSGIPRRAILASARFGGAELIEKAKDRDCAIVFAALVEAGDAWINRQRSLIELAEAQTLRLRMSLMERPDMEAVFAEALATLGETAEVAHHG